MGISTKDGTCDTCGEGLQQCNGLFGYIKLALPAFHIGYLKLTISILQNICKVPILFAVEYKCTDMQQECGRILLTEQDRRKFLGELRRARDNLHRKQTAKKINALCRKTDRCHYCGVLNGNVKKAGQHPLKIIHDQFRKYNSSKAMEKAVPAEKMLFDRSFAEAKKIHNEIDRHMKKAR